MEKETQVFPSRGRCGEMHKRVDDVLSLTDQSGHTGKSCPERDSGLGMEVVRADSTKKAFQARPIAGAKALALVGVSGNGKGMRLSTGIR